MSDYDAGISWTEEQTLDDLRRQLAEANAALAEAVKGLRTIAMLDYVELRAHGFSVGDTAISEARTTLARIEALKVQPEVAQ